MSVGPGETDAGASPTAMRPGKAYFVQIYKSLDAKLSGESDLCTRTQDLCAAWDSVHSLCLHSSPSTHAHLLTWIQLHTARTILQTEWQLPKNAPTRAGLEAVLVSFKEETTAAVQARGGARRLWEKELSLYANNFKSLLSDPWSHPVLRSLLDPKAAQPNNPKILKWLVEERGVMFMARLRQLASSKCHDLALSLASAVLDRSRGSTAPDDTQDATVKPNDWFVTPFAARLRRSAGFTDDVWDFLTDIELVTLHKAGKTARCIDIVKQTPLNNGYQLMERLKDRLEAAPKEKKLWKNAKEVATLVAQVIVTRCMVVPTCAGTCRAALYRCTRALVLLLDEARLPAVCGALAAPAATSKHLHTLAVAVESQCGQSMRPFVCELFVRAITAGMNELERLKLKTEKDSEARTMERTLATWFLHLSTVLKDNVRIVNECTLTAFSVHPISSMYEKLVNAPDLPRQEKEKTETVTSEFGSWATDSRSTKTNFVKTSETLNLKLTLQQTNVLSTKVLAEGEKLGLSPELCQDLAVLLSGPRVKTLSWDMDRVEMLENCRTYMERTESGTRTLTTELKFLNLDPSQYQHLPEEEDEDENDIYYGIEKGYEHLVELQQSSEEIWQPKYSDSEGTISCDWNTDAEKDLTSSNIKKHVDDETDPLFICSENVTQDNIIHKERNEISHKKVKKYKLSKKMAGPLKDPLSNEEISSNCSSSKVAEDPNLLYKKKTCKRKERRKLEKEARRKAKKELRLMLNDGDSNAHLATSLSLNTHVVEHNVVFDGLFSMDDLKPVVPEASDKDMLCQPKREIPTEAVEFTNSSTHSNILNPPVNSASQDVNKLIKNVTTSEYVKTSVRKLILFRKQKGNIDHQNSSAIALSNLQQKQMGNHDHQNNSAISSSNLQAKQTCNNQDNRVVGSSVLQQPCVGTTIDNNLVKSQTKLNNNDTITYIKSKYPQLLACNTILNKSNLSNTIINDYQTTKDTVLSLMPKQNTLKSELLIKQTCSTQTAIATKQPEIQNFLKDLHKTINAGTNNSQNNISSKRTTDVMGSSRNKSSIYQRNNSDASIHTTYSRLNYLHKNKCTENMKSKQLTDAQKVLLLQQSLSNLERDLEKIDKSKGNNMQNDNQLGLTNTHVSSLIASHPAMSSMLNSNLHLSYQKSISKEVTPTTSNVTKLSNNRKRYVKTPAVAVPKANPINKSVDILKSTQALNMQLTMQNRTSVIQQGNVKCPNALVVNTLNLAANDNSFKKKTNKSGASCNLKRYKNQSSLNSANTQNWEHVMDQLLSHRTSRNSVITSSDQKQNLPINKHTESVSRIPTQIPTTKTTATKLNLHNTISSANVLSNKETVDSDLLDELFDNDLLQEISELTSDEESYMEDVTPVTSVLSKPLKGENQNLHITTSKYTTPLHDKLKSNTLTFNQKNVVKDVDFVKPNMARQNNTRISTNFVSSTLVKSQRDEQDKSYSNIEHKCNDMSSQVFVTKSSTVSTVIPIINQSIQVLPICNNTVNYVQNINAPQSTPDLMYYTRVVYNSVPASQYVALSEPPAVTTYQVGQYLPSVTSTHIPVPSTSFCNQNFSTTRRDNIYNVDNSTSKLYPNMSNAVLSPNFKQSQNVVIIDQRFNSSRGISNNLSLKQNVPSARVITNNLSLEQNFPNQPSISNNLSLEQNVLSPPVITKQDATIPQGEFAGSDLNTLSQSSECIKTNVKVKNRKSARAFKTETNSLQTTDKKCTEKHGISKTKPVTRKRKTPAIRQTSNRTKKCQSKKDLTSIEYNTTTIDKPSDITSDVLDESQTAQVTKEMLHDNKDVYQENNTKVTSPFGFHKLKDNKNIDSSTFSQLSFDNSNKTSSKYSNKQQDLHASRKINEHFNVNYSATIVNDTTLTSGGCKPVNEFSTEIINHIDDKQSEGLRSFETTSTQSSDLIDFESELKGAQIFKNVTSLNCTQYISMDSKATYDNREPKEILFNSGLSELDDKKTCPNSKKSGIDYIASLSEVDIDTSKSLLTGYDKKKQGLAYHSNNNAISSNHESRERLTKCTNLKTVFNAKNEECSDKLSIEPHIDVIEPTYLNHDSQSVSETELQNDRTDIYNGTEIVKNDSDNVEVKLKPDAVVSPSNSILLNQSTEIGTTNSNKTRKSLRNRKVIIKQIITGEKCTKAKKNIKQDMKAQKISTTKIESKCISTISEADKNKIDRNIIHEKYIDTQISAHKHENLIFNSVSADTNSQLEINEPICLKDGNFNNTQLDSAEIMDIKSVIDTEKCVETISTNNADPREQNESENKKPKISESNKICLCTQFGNYKISQHFNSETLLKVQRQLLMKCQVSLKSCTIFNKKIINSDACIILGDQTAQKGAEINHKTLTSASILAEGIQLCIDQIVAGSDPRNIQNNNTSLTKKKIDDSSQQKNKSDFEHILSGDGVGTKKLDFIDSNNKDTDYENLRDVYTKNFENLKKEHNIVVNDSNGDGIKIISASEKSIDSADENLMQVQKLSESNTEFKHQIISEGSYSVECSETQIKTNDVITTAENNTGDVEVVLVTQNVVSAYIQDALQVQEPGQDTRPEESEKMEDLSKVQNKIIDLMTAAENNTGDVEVLPVVQNDVVSAHIKDALQVQEPSQDTRPEESEKMEDLSEVQNKILDLITVAENNTGDVEVVPVVQNDVVSAHIKDALQVQETSQDTRPEESEKMEDLSEVQNKIFDLITVAENNTGDVEVLPVVQNDVVSTHIKDALQVQEPSQDIRHEESEKMEDLCEVQNKIFDLITVAENNTGDVEVLPVVQNDVVSAHIKDALQVQEPSQDTRPDDSEKMEDLSEVQNKIFDLTTIAENNTGDIEVVPVTQNDVVSAHIQDALHVQEPSQNTRYRESEKMEDLPEVRNKINDVITSAEKNTVDVEVVPGTQNDVVSAHIKDALHVQEPSQNTSYRESEKMEDLSEVRNKINDVITSAENNTVDVEVAGTQNDVVSAHIKDELHVQEPSQNTRYRESEKIEDLSEVRNKINDVITSAENNTVDVEVVPGTQNDVVSAHIKDAWQVQQQSQDTRLDASEKMEDLSAVRSEISNINTVAENNTSDVEVVSVTQKDVVSAHIQDALQVQQLNQDTRPEECKKLVDLFDDKNDDTLPCNTKDIEKVEINSLLKIHIGNPIILIGKSPITNKVEDLTDLERELNVHSVLNNQLERNDIILTDNGNINGHKDVLQSQNGIISNEDHQNTMHLQQIIEETNSDDDKNQRENACVQQNRTKHILKSDSVNKVQLENKIKDPIAFVDLCQNTKHNECLLVSTSYTKDDVIFNKVEGMSGFVNKARITTDCKDTHESVQTALISGTTKESENMSDPLLEIEDVIILTDDCSDTDNFVDSSEKTYLETSSCSQISNKNPENELENVIILTDENEDVNKSEVKFDLCVNSVSNNEHKIVSDLCDDSDDVIVLDDDEESTKDEDITCLKNQLLHDLTPLIRPVKRQNRTNIDIDSITELRNELLEELSIFNSSSKPIIEEVIELSDSENEDIHNFKTQPCYVKLFRCDNMIKKQPKLRKKCVVKLVRCDYLLQRNKTTQIQYKRHAFDIKRTSPIMTMYDILLKLKNHTIPNAYNITRALLDPVKCDAEWFHNKCTILKQRTTQITDRVTKLDKCIISNNNVLETIKCDAEWSHGKIAYINYLKIHNDLENNVFTVPTLISIVLKVLNKQMYIQHHYTLNNFKCNINSKRKNDTDVQVHRPPKITKYSENDIRSQNNHSEASDTCIKSNAEYIIKGKCLSNDCSAALADVEIENNQYHSVTESNDEDIVHFGTNANFDLDNGFTISKDVHKNLEVLKFEITSQVKDFSEKVEECPNLPLPVLPLLDVLQSDNKNNFNKLGNEEYSTLNLTDTKNMTQSDNETMLDTDSSEELFSYCMEEFDCNVKIDENVVKHNDNHTIISVESMEDINVSSDSVSPLSNTNVNVGEGVDGELPDIVEKKQLPSLIDCIEIYNSSIKIDENVRHKENQTILSVEPLEETDTIRNSVSPLTNNDINVVKGVDGESHETFEEQQLPSSINCIEVYDHIVKIDENVVRHKENHTIISIEPLEDTDTISTSVSPLTNNDINVVKGVDGESRETFEEQQLLSSIDYNIENYGHNVKIDENVKRKENHTIISITPVQDTDVINNSTSPLTNKEINVVESVDGESPEISEEHPLPSLIDCIENDGHNVKIYENVVKCEKSRTIISIIPMEDTDVISNSASPLTNKEINVVEDVDGDSPEIFEEQQLSASIDNSVDSDVIKNDDPIQVFSPENDNGAILSGSIKDHTFNNGSNLRCNNCVPVTQYLHLNCMENYHHGFKNDENVVNRNKNHTIISVEPMVDTYVIRDSVSPFTKNDINVVEGVDGDSPKIFEEQQLPASIENSVYKNNDSIKEDTKNMKMCEQVSSLENDSGTMLSGSIEDHTYNKSLNEGDCVPVSEDLHLYCKERYNYDNKEDHTIVSVETLEYTDIISDSVSPLTSNDINVSESVDGESSEPEEPQLSSYSDNSVYSNVINCDDIIYDTGLIGDEIELSHMAEVLEDVSESNTENAEKHSKAKTILEASHNLNDIIQIVPENKSKENVFNIVDVQSFDNSSKYLNSGAHSNITSWHISKGTIHSVYKENNSSKNDGILCTQVDNFKLLKPYKTYSIKRKFKMDEVTIIKKKKFRYDKDINVGNALNRKSIENTSYKAEFSSLCDYNNALNYSVNSQFHNDCENIHKVLREWPINKNVLVHCENLMNIDTEIRLYEEDEAVQNNFVDSKTIKPFVEEISEDISKDYISTFKDEIVDMGFGEGSDRIIQNTVNGHIKSTAAILSDVKHIQPFVMSSEDCKTMNINKLNDEFTKISLGLHLLNLKAKVKSFFEKSANELIKYSEKSEKYDVFLRVPGLYDTDFMLPQTTQHIVQVVQVGQLPLSATSCDSRITPVTDASPSQCSVNNSPHSSLNDNAQTTNEYTELTNADLSIPTITQNMREADESQTIISTSSQSPDTPLDTDDPRQNMDSSSSSFNNNCNDNKVQLNENSSHEHQNNIDLQYDMDTSATSISEPTLQLIFNNGQQNNFPDEFLQHKYENGFTDKSDQLANAMTAAGIATTNNRAHTLVNIFSQKLARSSDQSNQSITTSSTVNSYTKTTAINAVSLQQALAQILPQSLNHSRIDDQQVRGAQFTPQVLHIVQGKNATGNQITLVDNNQQSVITSPNTAQVLHIVQQNKASNSALATNGSQMSQSNSYGGISLVDAGLHQGNSLLHIVNAGPNHKSNATGLLKRVNLLTNLGNVQATNEQKMVQFVCKSADGKSIQVNAAHQRSMVVRLQPIESTNVQAQKEVEGPLSSPTSSVTMQTKESSQEIKSRSVYEENYAKFIQNSSTKPSSAAGEKSTSLPKFNQAFGKPVFQDGTDQKQIEMTSNDSQLHDVKQNADNSECNSDNSVNIEHIRQINSPPPMMRKTTASCSQAQPSIVQQVKQTIAPMNIQTMHGGVIYTRQIPVNIGGGQTINLITVPSTELMEDSSQKHADLKFAVNQNEMEPSIIKIVPQTPAPNAEVNPEEGNPHMVTSENQHPVLTQMRIKLPMLSKAPQMVPGTRVVRPSFFQIQRNVIGGSNQLYQQLVLTSAPPTQTIRLPQPQVARHVKAPTENQSSESHLSSSTLEQLREFDMVLEQVKERSTVQPTGGLVNTVTHLAQNHSSDTVDSSTATTISTEHTQQVLYSIGGNQSVNVAYVNTKTITSTPSTFARSPDSSGVADSPTSSQVSQVVQETRPETHHKPTRTSSRPRPRPSRISASLPSALRMSVPPKTSTQKPLEDEQTTQRILYILAEYKEQVENSPDKDKPAPRRRAHHLAHTGGSKRKKGGSRRPGSTREPSPAGDDASRTMGSEDSSCGTSQGDCNESCLDAQSPQGSPRKVARKLAYDREPESQPPPLQPAPQPQPQPQSQPQPQPQPHPQPQPQPRPQAVVTRGKPATVLMPANYILPVSVVKGGQQIAIVTNRGPKLVAVGEGGAANALLLQRVVGPTALKPVLTRPAVRHVRLPLHALGLTPAQSAGTTSSAPTCSPDRYLYDDPAATPRSDRTVLDTMPGRYSPDMEAQRIFDKMFDMKKTFIVDPHGQSPRVGHGYDLDGSHSDSDDKVYQQVVHKKEHGSSSHGGLHRLSAAAALRHKYAVLEHELRLQKSLSEECEDLGVDSPSASELFPEAELLFAGSPAQDHAQDSTHSNHNIHTTVLNQSTVSQPDMEDQIVTDQLIPKANSDQHDDHQQDDLVANLGLEDVGIVTVSEDSFQTTIAVDHEEFARSHPNTTFHRETTYDAEVQPFTLADLKSRHITSTIFHSHSAATVLMAAPTTHTVISQATVPNNTVKYTDIDNIIDSLPGPHNPTDLTNLSSVLVKDARFDSILNNREVHLSNATSAIVHAAGTTQVIRRVRYDNEKIRDSRFMIDEPESVIAGDDPKMTAVDASRDRCSPERHAELFWEESRRPIDFSSDSDKCCKSPSYDDTNSTDSSFGPMRLDSVIKEARSRKRSGNAEGSSTNGTNHPPLRTYPPKRIVHPESERSLTGKTRAGESPDNRRRASGRGVVKRGCHCCNGSPAPSRPKKPRQRKPAMDFTISN